MGPGRLRQKRRRCRHPRRLFLSKHYSEAATFLPCLARSRSITTRQPLLNWLRCLIMQAVIAGVFGISELQSLNASPVHICCASALNAKLLLDDKAATETAKASTQTARRIVPGKE